MSDSPSTDDTKETSSLTAPADPMQMMSSLMAGLGGMPQRALPSPNNINRTIDIDLKDIYNGTTKELEIERRVIQDEPTEEPTEETDTEANFKIETKKVTVTIEKGHYKDTIVFKGKGHQLTENEIGDLIVTIEVNEHEYYDRDNNDLVMKKEVSLNDALCGFTFKIKDINDNELIVTTDKIIDVEPMGLVGKGLPDIDSPETNTYGNIVILFDVIFPETLDKETKGALRKLLPDSETSETSEEDKVLTLEDVEYDTDTDTETETESDEEERIGQMPVPPPGCATQ